jgi:tRNA dimethylallyltransferase
MSAWQTQWKEDRPALDPVNRPRALYLNPPRPVLYHRIDARVDKMITEGLVDEVRALRRLNRPLSREATQAVGYKEVFEHLDGRATLEEMITRIQQRTRQLAKRQLTWFRHLPGCHPATEELTFRYWALTMGG